MKTNPWIDVDLADYEAHMAMPTVGQTAMLSREFRRAVERFQPRSLALVGCAGGNGLDELADFDVTRVVCVDISPDYLQKLTSRYAGKVRGLETLCCELERLQLSEKVDLVFGGLVFEYTRLDEALHSVARVIRPQGRFYALTQMPAVGVSVVTPTPYAAMLSGVAESFQYVDAEALSRLALRHDLYETERRVVTLTSGKSFTITEYEKR